MGTMFSKWTTAIRAHGRRFIIIVAGQGIFQTVTWGIDFIFLPAFILWFGILWGSIIYMAVSLIVDWISIVAYNRIKDDVLGLELIKKWVGFLVQRFLKTPRKISEIPFWMKIFFGQILSVWFSSFEIVVVMRPAHYYSQKMSREDKIIFWTSFIGGSLYWIVLWGATIEFLRPYLELL